jgi:hypothetical protein
MPLTMRPTKLSSPVDNDRQDFTVYCGADEVIRSAAAICDAKHCWHHKDLPCHSNAAAPTR